MKPVSRLLAFRSQYPFTDTIALRGIGLILLDIIRVPPVRHVIAFAGNYIDHAQRPSLAIIPAHTTVDGSTVTPLMVHLIPNFRGKSQVRTSFNYTSLSMFLQRFQCLLRVSPVAGQPDLVLAPSRALLLVVSNNLIIRPEVVPEALCILNIKKMIRAYLPCLGGGAAENQ